MQEGVFIVTIQIKKKTTHGYIILEFERFIELLYIKVGCISGIIVYFYWILL